MFEQLKIPIKNLLYMYSYAWDMVSAQRLIQLAATDNFTSTDIFAELFLINVNQVLHRGLQHQYVEYTADLNCARGRIDFVETMTKLKISSGRLHCEFDEFTEDVLLNQIIKYIAIKLYHCRDLNLRHRGMLRKVLLQLNYVSYHEITAQDLRRITFNRMNIHYKLIIKICELIIKAIILSSKEGEFDFDQLFQDEKELERLFERFVCNFYRSELSPKYQVCYQDQLKWKLIGGDQSLIPNMRLDIQITEPEGITIIDTKFYKSYLVEYHETKKFHSSHLYQIAAYLHNISIDETKSLRGILLYPQPYEEPGIHESYGMSIMGGAGPREASLEVHTINLGNEWSEIRQELLQILNPHSIFAIPHSLC